MKVTYTGPLKRVHIPCVGKFDAGTIEVPDDVGQALVTHPDWEQPKAAPAKKKDDD